MKFNLLRNSSSISCRLLAHFRFVYCESGTYLFSKQTFFLNLQILWQFLSDVASPFKRAFKKWYVNKITQSELPPASSPVYGFQKIWVFDFFIVFVFFLILLVKFQISSASVPYPHTHIGKCWLWWQHGRFLNACAVPEPTADERKLRSKNARERFLLYDDWKTKQVGMSNDANLARHHRLSVFNGALYSSVYLF